MKLWQRFENELERARQAIPGGPEGWRPERLIFRDWWHWKDQEFGFAHGRLALTGQNAGGKSSILALMIPMLLDGRTDPPRLDPAQSRDRFLYYYLIGPDGEEADNPEAFHYEARTGYVALEFYHVTDKRYLTIGMGMTAVFKSARKITDWWGFLLLQNQRIGRDFDVRGADEACLGRREITRALGQNGVVVTERADYQRLVNQHLFGMEEDDYHALIEMLLQARRPKLGEQSGPDWVCEKLSQALPGIPVDRLTRVGEVINNIEEYRRNLLDVNEKAEAVGRIDLALLALAEALVQDAAVQYQEAQAHHGNLASKLRSARDSLSQAEQELAKLALCAGERTVEMAQAKASLDELKKPDDGNLQERLTAARQAQAKEASRVRALEGQIRQAQESLTADQAARDRHASEFDTRKRATVTSERNVLRLAESIGWQEGARSLADAIRHTEVLSITDPEEVVADAGPGMGLGDQARNLALAFRRASRVASDCEEATRERDRVAALIQGLRGEVKAATEQAELAKDQVEADGDFLIQTIADWAEACSSLEPSADLIAGIIATIRERVETVSGGHRTFTEPLFLLGERRRQELDRAQEELAARLTAAQVRLTRLNEDQAQVDADPGNPVQSEVRAAARAGLGGRAFPLFRHIRFRPHVPPETAARVEAAMLEAGWLDLLAAPVAGADAYLLPEPLGGPTLCEVLEPLPDAPPATGPVLASIGWGQGAGDRWVAPDGSWRNGPAHGTVAPWAPRDAGYVGSDARQRRKERRLHAIATELSAARDLHDRLSTEYERHQHQKDQIETELRQLDRLPWPTWFAALNLMQNRQQVWQAARTRLEDAKPKLNVAERALLDAERRLDEAVEGLPEARGLSAGDLSQRGDQLVDVASRLDGLLPLYRELIALTRGFQQEGRRMENAQQALTVLRSDLTLAQTDEASASASVAALEEQIQDPELQSRLEKLHAIEERMRQLDHAAQEDEKSKVSFLQQKAGAISSIAQLEPDERHWGEERARRLEQVKERLHLHVALNGHLEALEKAGPVAYMPKLLRLVETDNLAEEIGRRRTALWEQEHSERSRLIEYPVAKRGQDSLVFYDERIPLAAHLLRDRLQLRAREYAELMEEEQRKLFQDIIYEGILDELRRLIRQAREFTRRTNEKLRHPLSNGEVLSLRWSPVPAGQVPAARIGSALEQMEQGARFLSEEKREVLLSTIREEVERVRTVAKAQGRELSYHEAVAQALDYRKWYEFQILSKMPGSSHPLPIRTKGFGKRSTSAKAWALAVPILAAVAARYDSSPRCDVPRLVGLDEAFAGFDTRNQENYVELLTALRFCWIITIPDEVPYTRNLSAVMTYRMSLEGNFHTGFPILWNGDVAYDPMSAWNEETAAGLQP